MSDISLLQPTLQITLFWLFSLLMLGFAFAVVILRNPVSSAMSLVCSFIALAGLFMTLNAYFIGIVQILVSAGAVMVLFLFIIMLLNLQSSKEGIPPLGILLGSIVIITSFLKLLSDILSSSPQFAKTMPPLETTLGGDALQIGMNLFHTFNLPFQVVGILLLAATVGVVVLSRKTLR